MCITGVGSYPVWSAGLLSIIPVPLSIGKMALNRETVLHTC